MFKSILIANRGEIACRIIQTCRRLKIKTFAIGSTADQAAMHMQMADEAILIGPPPAQESYLNSGAIIKAALHHKVEAIHPGYGFLSENPVFAENVRKSGLVFIGPSSRAIQIMGSKSEAKAIAQSVNVPIIPGYDGSDLISAARKIGFPLLIKATYGGGGKGMRHVDHEKDFGEALAACQREALAAFGNDQVLLERYVENPRHIEVQIIGDQHGKCIVLSDRDCSLQRRHQKVIEEAPASGLSDTLRSHLHEAAIKIGQAISYEGVGTVEFLVDEKGKYFFLEMNTRLQVEHPITEMVLDLDLVEWQFRIAAGAPLSLKNEECQPTGYAIEARLYAEDGEKEFLPSTGKITHLDLPAMKNVRVDTGVQQGDEVTIYYDPLLAKISAWGKNRDAALKKLAEALTCVQVRGLKTNLNFLQRLLIHPEITNKLPDNGFIDRTIAEEKINTSCPVEAYIIATIWLYIEGQSKGIVSPWGNGDGWRLNADAVYRFNFSGGIVTSLKVDSRGLEIYHEDGVYRPVQVSNSKDKKISFTLNGKKFHSQIVVTEEEIYVQLAQNIYRLRLMTGHEQEISRPGAAHLLAPMPGRITCVFVKEDDAVISGQSLMVLEAMKMEHTIRAPYEGVVEYLPFKAGDFCEEGVELVRLKE
ncbi:MAG: ATP-grasp domain-containing protein [Alphaproteobacteria bacterium]|nr:ATP-grasp domain-containing protein [Alphaproteobacteria bacterium]